MPCHITVWTLSWTGLVHFASILCVQFFSPGSWYLFCDTRSQIKRWRISVYHRFVYSFSRSFQLSFFIIRKFPFLKIIGYVDIMLTMCFAHCIFFMDSSKISFDSFTNYIFLLLKAIYLQCCIRFCFSPFFKNTQEVEQWNVDLFISLIPVTQQAGGLK